MCGETREEPEIVVCRSQCNKFIDMVYVVTSTMQTSDDENQKKFICY